MLTLATSSLFSTGHIALTGLVSGILAAAVALLWLRDEHRILDSVAIGVLTAAAVFMLRKSANMAQLNDDGSAASPQTTGWRRPSLGSSSASTVHCARQAKIGDTSKRARRRP